MGLGRIIRRVYIRLRIDIDIDVLSRGSKDSPPARAIASREANNKLLLWYRPGRGAARRFSRIKERGFQLGGRLWRRPLSDKITRSQALTRAGTREREVNPHFLGPG